jgi:hypothetical protein
MKHPGQVRIQRPSLKGKKKATDAGDAPPHQPPTEIPNHKYQISNK